MKKTTADGKYIRPTAITKYNRGAIIFRNSREIDGMLSARLDYDSGKCVARGQYYNIYPNDVVAALFLSFGGLKSYLGAAPADKDNSVAKTMWMKRKSIVAGFIRRELFDLFPQGKIFLATTHGGYFRVEYYFRVAAKDNYPDARFVREAINDLEIALKNWDFDPDGEWAA